MKKQILFFAVAALALASCSSDKIAEEKQVAQQQAEPGAVLFEAYTQRGVTRAGTVGTLTTDGMKSGAFKDDGFGVFGYYTDNNTYDKLYLPNFMYNEKVTWDDTKWTYEPVKYWPNEYGSTAISDDQDKVSFFAYAPYVLVSPATGKVVNAEGDEFKQDESAELQKWGITSMTRNTATGDPLIKYLVSFDPAHSVDLCWGVCDEEVWTKVVDGGNQSFEKGKPWIDVQRPANAVDQKLKFTFKHATSQLNVQVDAFVDGTDNTNPIADGSKVYIRSITFEGFATQGTLNLNNNDVNPNQAYWLDYAGTNDLVTGETVTIYDGRKDGKEGTIGGEATNEKVLGLNPQLIQSDLWSKNTTTGVTNTSVNLFRKWDKTEGKYVAAGLLEPIYVIPTGDAVKVTIVYDIETADGKLATYLSDAETNGSSIPNTISKTINFGNSTTFENGKSYTIKLHLGLNSVKFDATVSDWKEAGGWSQTDLPANVPVYTATTSSPSTNVTLAANQTTYQFAVSGLTPNAAIEQNSGVNDGTIVTGYSVLNGTANSSGVALATATLAKNTTVNETTTGWAKVIEGSNTFQVNFTQKAAPLGMKVTAVDGSAKTITLSSTATGSPWADVTSGDKIKVLKNGVALTYKGTGEATAATEFEFATGTITLGKAPVAGDVYSITVQAGKAPEETYTISIGKISFAVKSGWMGVEKNKTKYIDVVNTGDGKLLYQQGSVWTSTGSTIDGETGLFTASDVTGDNVVKVTVSNSDHCFYLADNKNIWGHVGVAVYVLGQNYTYGPFAKAGQNNAVFSISGFVDNETITAVSSETWITVKSHVTTSGICSLIFDIAENGTSASRTATITLTGTNGKTVLTLTQAGT